MNERPAKRQRVDVDRNFQEPFRAHDGHEFSSTTVNGSGQTSIHQGDNSGVHHHHYGEAAKETSQNAEAAITEQLMASLLFERIDERINTVKPAMQKTCTWLAKHKHYKAWMGDDWESHNGFLWIRGKPGSGKSTIMKHTLREVQRHHKSWLITSYFFNARASGALEKSSEGFYRSVIHSLLTASKTFRKPFYSTFCRKARGDAVDSWTQEELQNWLVDLFQLPDLQSVPICIFIDALDEGDVKDVQDLINALDDLATSAAANGHKLRICLSSRHYPQVVFNRGLSLSVEDQADHDADIELYIQNKLIDASCDEMRDLRAEMHRRSQHVFLWVVLVITILNEDNAAGATIDDMKARLREIPSDLNGLFRQILARPGKSIVDCIRLLRWVRFAFRPLKPEELYLAIRCRLSKPDDMLAFSKLPESGRLERFILETSRGLVEITKSKNPTVQFIHETVRAYVLSPKDLDAPRAAKGLSAEAIAHDEVSEDCCTYIDHCQFVPGYRRKNMTQAQFATKLGRDYPFLAYALDNAYRHADKAAENGAPQSHFLKSRSNCLGSWQDHHFRQWRDEVQKFEIRKYGNVSLPLVYMLVDNDLHNLLREAIDLGHDVNRAGGRYSSPLGAACVVGNLKTVQLLLNNKAKHDVVHMSPVITPWALAMSSKKFDVAHALYEHGFRVEQNVLRSTLLQQVARNSVQGIHAALKAGADPDTRNDIGQTAMVVAIKKHNLDAYEALATNGARSFEGTLYETMHREDAAAFNKVLRLGPLPHPDLDSKHDLYAAAALLVWSLLVAARADVSHMAADNPDQNPPQGRKAKCLELLLKAGVDLNTQKSTGVSALDLAATEGECDVLDLLMRHGATVRPLYSPAIAFHLAKHDQAVVDREELDPQYLPFWSVENICAALEKSCITCVEGFIGVTKTDRWSLRDCEEVLYTAVRFGSRECVRAVLNVGRIASCVQNREIASSIRIAAKQHNPGTIELLLDYGACVNEMCTDPVSSLTEPCTPLSVATYGKSADTVVLLLQRGADVLTNHGPRCLPPLQYAARFSTPEIVKMMIDSLQSSNIDKTTRILALRQALGWTLSAGMTENSWLLSNTINSLSP